VSGGNYTNSLSRSWIILKVGYRRGVAIRTPHAVIQNAGEQSGVKVHKAELPPFKAEGISREHRAKSYPVGISAILRSS